MEVISTYSEEIKNTDGAFKTSVEIYRAAVDFFIRVADREWDAVATASLLNERQRIVERFTVSTKKRPSVPYDFAQADRRFYKMPSYLRRAAINEALGKVSSYRSSLANWETDDPAERGSRPGFPKAGYVYPALYRKNMYLGSIGSYTAQIKVYIRNTWDWITVNLRKSDVDYIKRHCQPFNNGCGVMIGRQLGAPTLQKRHKKWYLDFPVTEKVALDDIPADQQTIVAVDLGINNACTCSIMTSGGTVLGREFLSLPGENDCLNRAVNRIRKAQRQGAGKTPRLWAYANGINDDIAVKTARFITDTAVRYNADVIVMEHLDTQGKKRGSKKQRLHLWKSQYVQAMVTQKAHRSGIRISRVCAWNTSRLAFDGSGKVLRGKESGRTAGNYSICEFSTGKIYNCDLNASYNIGARYFIRELLKPLPARERLLLEAKVPAVSKRSTCTLSTLISLNAALTA